MVRTEERQRIASTEPHKIVERSEAIPRRSAITLLVAWVVLFPLAIALEPLPAATDPVPWWGIVAEIGLLAALAATVTGLVRSKRWGVGASLVASSIFTLGVFACPATGHHAMGFWWFGELAAAIALVALSARTYAQRS